MESRRIEEEITKEEIDELKKWRNDYPEAIKEESEKFEPLVFKFSNKHRITKDSQEIWMNSKYEVSKQFHEEDTVFGSRHGIIILQISNSDGSAKHDWRDFQEIKNQLAGPDWEGIELYPREDRLRDPSNAYYLFCFKVLIKIGQKRRLVLKQKDAIAPQRAFPGEKDE